VTNSKQIGALLGPTMVAMLVAEFPLVQPHLYDDQIPSVIYLSGGPDVRGWFGNRSSSQCLGA
jgi:hypothetical protein